MFYENLERKLEIFISIDLNHKFWKKKL